jgi:plastocyanin
MQPMRRLAIPLTLLALLAAACGGDDDGGGGGGGGAEGGTSSAACPSGSVEIKMVDIKFDPAEATAGVGQEICWINEDTVEHDAVAESDATFRSELFGKDETFTTTIDAPGTVDYVCTVHPGMTGKITVER